MKNKSRIKKRPNKALKKLEQLSNIKKGGSLVRIGLPKNSGDYPDGTSVIMVGIIHEFGSAINNIPERSFLRSTMAKNRRIYSKFIAKLAKEMIKGNMTKKEALTALGVRVSEDVRSTIARGEFVPLKRPRSGKGRVSTEGNDNPLNDIGHLKKSITFVVGK